MAAIPWRKLISAYERDLKALFRAYAIMGSEGLLEFGDSRKFEEAARRVAAQMVTGLSRVNYRNWRESAFKSGHGRNLYLGLKQELAETSVKQTLERIAAENARLIRSIPQNVAREVTAHAMKAYGEGKRAPEVAKELRRLAPKLTESKIKLISRTEIGRAESAITETRSLELGLPFYVWTTSQDQRVRESHRKMSGVIVPWADPPSPEALIGEKSTLGRYHCGASPNCRCLSLSLVSLDEVSWPHKLYSNGSIRMITRADFQRRLPIAA